jgi:hypothetical protein
MSTVDGGTVRGYRHPVLGDRRVVRIAPAALGAVEARALATLGFTATVLATPDGPVADCRGTTGFLGWAAVHAPAAVERAIAVLPEIERFGRMARQGRHAAALKGFEALAAGLARSAPSLLPAFYEQAAREFLAADGPPYAAMMFNRARAAETRHGLAVDEAHHHAAYLEFALAGAVTGAGLSAYARALGRRLAPAAAYERFSRFCVALVLGGRPPHPGMPDDLRRLARRARVDRTAAERAFVGSLVPAPAMRHAPATFWTAYRDQVTALADTDPAVRDWLGTVTPDRSAGFEDVTGRRCREPGP